MSLLPNSKSYTYTNVAVCNILTEQHKRTPKVPQLFQQLWRCPFTWLVPTVQDGIMFCCPFSLCGIDLGSLNQVLNQIFDKRTWLYLHSPLPSALPINWVEILPGSECQSLVSFLPQQNKFALYYLVSIRWLPLSTHIKYLHFPYLWWEKFTQELIEICYFIILT